MKILIIEPCTEGYGGYFRAFGIAKALSKKGIKVDILLSSNKKISLIIEKKQINNNLTQYNLPRIYINFFITGRILRGILGCFFILFKKYDLIHIFTIVQFESNIPFLLAKAIRKNIIIDWDDYWSDAHYLVPIYNNFLIRNYLKFCENKLQKIVSNATATSDFLIQKLKMLGVKNRFKIINGVDKEQFYLMSKNEARERLKISGHEKIILSFGNTFFKERTIYLFKTFEEIHKLDPNIKLYFNLSPKKLLIEQSSDEIFDNDIFENILDIGYLNKEKLSLYMGAADCVLFTMGNTTLEKACFPTRIGTYLNGERIIITNDTETEACNVLKENESALIGKDPYDIAKKTVAFLNNIETQKKFEKNIRQAKEKLAWDNLIEGLINFYKTKVLQDNVEKNI